MKQFLDTLLRDANGAGGTAAASPPAPGGEAGASTSPPPAAGSGVSSPPADPAAGLDLGADPAQAPTSDLGDAPAETEAPPVNEFIGVPEGDYEPLTMPEGFTLNQELFAEFSPVAKELGLSQKGAQRLGEFYAKLQQKQIETWQNHSTELRQAALADAEIGGAKFAESVRLGQRAIQTFGTPGVAKVLRDYGLGSHPEVVRFFARVGAAISESPSTASAGGGEVSARPLHELMFPTHRKEP